MFKMHHWPMLLDFLTEMCSFAVYFGGINFFVEEYLVSQVFQIKLGIFLVSNCLISPLLHLVFNISVFYSSLVILCVYMYWTMVTHRLFSLFFVVAWHLWVIHLIKLYVCFFLSHCLTEGTTKGGGGSCQVNNLVFSILILALPFSCVCSAHNQSIPKHLMDPWSGIFGSPMGQLLGGGGWYFTRYPKLYLFKLLIISNVSRKILAMNFPWICTMFLRAMRLDPLDSESGLGSWLASPDWCEIDFWNGV